MRFGFEEKLNAYYSTSLKGGQKCVSVRLHLANSSARQINFNCGGKVLSKKENDNVTAIPLSQIADFPDHPYQVRDDDSMNELVESIKERGLIQPILVRPVENGRYEMVSGHRRKRALLHRFRRL